MRAAWGGRVRRLVYWLFLLVFVVPVMLTGAVAGVLRSAERRLYLWQRDEVGE